uniref:Putative secreted protein n=1 Tax=Anopheles triannulatus TaxID=58253 RepID=A0A2M4B5R5_9DIPT
MELSVCVCVFVTTATDQLQLGYACSVHLTRCCTPRLCFIGACIYIIEQASKRKTELPSSRMRSSFNVWSWVNVRVRPLSQW